MGFSALFFGRIDYQDLAWRTQKAAAEFVWRASESLGARRLPGATTGKGHGLRRPTGLCGTPCGPYEYVHKIGATAAERVVIIFAIVWTLPDGFWGVLSTLPNMTFKGYYLKV